MATPLFDYIVPPALHITTAETAAGTNDTIELGETESDGLPDVERHRFFAYNAVTRATERVQKSA
jgi:hypothetical protein